MSPDSVVARLAATASRAPEAIAYHGAGFPPVTWREVADRVRRAALGLAEWGVVQGEPVAVNAPSTLNAPALELGIVAAGGVSVWPAEVSSRVLRALGARRVLSDDAELAELMELGARLDGAEPERFGKLVAEILPEDAATVVLTGGAGADDLDPNATAVSHGDLLAAVDALSRQLRVRAGDVTVVFLPLHDITGRLAAVYWPASVGASVRLPSSPDPVADIRSAQPSVVIADAEAALALAEAIGEVSNGPARRRALELGRLAAAGETLGPLAQAALVALAPTAGAAVREELGLAGCRSLLVIDRVPAWVTRDLRAVGLPIADGMGEATP